MSKSTVNNLFFQIFKIQIFKQRKSEIFNIEASALFLALCLNVDEVRPN